MESYQQRIFGAGICTIFALALGGWMLPKQPASSMSSEWFWSNKVQPGRQFEILVIGDSRIYRGFSPDDFAATYAPEKNLSILNFGFSSVGLDTSFLRAAALLLDTTVEQPIIILGITTSSLADENAINKHFWQEQNRSTTSIWQRKYINPHLTYFDPSSPNTLRNQWLGNRQGYYQKYYNNGWIASDKQPHALWEYYDYVKRTYPNVVFSVDFRLRLLAQIAEWQAQGIQVVAFRPPAAPHLEKLEMQPNYYPEAAIKAQIQSLGGIWLDLPNREQYKTYDGNHLVEASARKLSRKLGSLLQQALQQKASLYPIPQQQTKRHVLWQTNQDFETANIPNRIEEVTAPHGKQIQYITAEGFSYTHTYDLNKLPLDSLQLTASAWVRLPDSLCVAGATLVISVEDSTHKMLLWQGQSLLEQMINHRVWTKVQLSVPYNHQHADALLKAYIWNNSKQQVFLDQLTLKIETQ